MQPFNVPPFYRFLREERQFCAAVAHLLLQKNGNLKAFLELLSSRCGAASSVPCDQLEDAEIYVEFAYLRDMWAGFGSHRTRDEANQRKRDFIREAFEHLGITERLTIDFDAPVADFNHYFVARQTIKDEIASPHHWELKCFDELLGGVDGDTFGSLCKFKWSFNIKPDMIIVIPSQPPLCIEAKLESREGCYPTTAGDVEVFEKHLSGRANRVRQFELQKFMFERLLRTPAEQVVIARKVSRGTTHHPPVLTWAEIAQRMDFADSMPFVRRLFVENTAVGPGGANSRS